MLHNEELEIRMLTNEVKHLEKECQCSLCKKKQIKGDYLISPEFEMIEKKIVSRHCFYQLLVIWVTALHCNDEKKINHVLELVQSHAGNSENWLNHFLCTCFAASGHRYSNTLFFYVMYKDKSFNQKKRKALFLSIMTRISANFTGDMQSLCLTDVWTLLDYPVVYSDTQEALCLYAQDEFEDYTNSRGYFDDWMRASGVFGDDPIKHLCGIIEDKLKSEKKDRQLCRNLQKAKWKLNRLSSGGCQSKGRKKITVSIDHEFLSDQRIEDIVNAIGPLDNASPSVKSHKGKKKKKKKKKRDKRKQKNEAKIKQEECSVVSCHAVHSASAPVSLKRQSLMLKPAFSDSSDVGGWQFVSSRKLNSSKEKEVRPRDDSTAWVGVSEVKIHDSNKSARYQASDDSSHAARLDKSLGLMFGQLPLSPISKSKCQSIKLCRKDSKGGNMLKSDECLNDPSVKKRDLSPELILKPAVLEADDLRKVIRFNYASNEEQKVESQRELNSAAITNSFSLFAVDNSTPTKFVSLRSEDSNAVRSGDIDQTASFSERYQYDRDFLSCLRGK